VRVFFIICLRFTNVTILIAFVVCSVPFRVIDDTFTRAHAKTNRWHCYVRDAALRTTRRHIRNVFLDENAISRQKSNGSEAKRVWRRDFRVDGFFFGAEAGAADVIFEGARTKRNTVGLQRPGAVRIPADEPFCLSGRVPRPPKNNSVVGQVGC